jgi:hypothetical protein
MRTLRDVAVWGYNLNIHFNSKFICWFPSLILPIPRTTMFKAQRNSPDGLFAWWVNPTISRGKNRYDT